MTRHSTRAQVRIGQDARGRRRHRRRQDATRTQEARAQARERRQLRAMARPQLRDALAGIDAAAGAMAA